MGRSGGLPRPDGPTIGGTPLTQSQPPVARTTHTLPFDKLSPRNFERLCLWLVVWVDGGGDCDCGGVFGPRMTRKEAKGAKGFRAFRGLSRVS